MEDPDVPTADPSGGSIAGRTEALFRKIKQHNRDYLIYALGSLCVRYMKNTHTRQTIRDGAAYDVPRARHADWSRRWPSLAFDYDNQRNAIRWELVSNHSFGTAIDINPPTNPYKAGKEFDIPPWLVALFRDAGFSWGGYYHDYMHFESSRERSFRGRMADISDGARQSSQQERYHARSCARAQQTVLDVRTVRGCRDFQATPGSPSVT